MLVVVFEIKELMVMVLSRRTQSILDLDRIILICGPYNHKGTCSLEETVRLCFDASSVK